MDTVKQILFNVNIFFQNIMRSLALALAMIRHSMFGEVSELKIYLKNADTTEQSVDAILSVVDPKIIFTMVHKEEDADIIIESKTKSLGFMFVDGKLSLYIPLRNGNNDATVDLIIRIFSFIIGILGKLGAFV